MKYNIPNEENIQESFALVHWIINHLKWRPPSLPYDDIFQIGCIGLLKAIRTFDKDKNIKFNTWAGRLILCEILNELRKYNAKMRDLKTNKIYHLEHHISRNTDIMLKDSLQNHKELYIEIGRASCRERGFRAV